jgi:hypothetical protein
LDSLLDFLISGLHLFFIFLVVIVASLAVAFLT